LKTIPPSEVVRLIQIIVAADELKTLVKELVAAELKKRRVRSPPPAKVGLSKQEFSASVGICVTSVEDEIRAGRLEALKVGRRTLITVEERDRYLAGLERARFTGRLRRADRESVASTP
jgi:hypothetical protein